MKITKSSKQLATNYGEGTVFYAVSLDAAIDAFKTDGNLFLAAELETNRWNHLDLEHNLYGSGIIENVLYICVTDGHTINIADSDDGVDPEDLIDTYGADFVDYAPVADPDSSTIRKYLSAYEFTDLPINHLGYQLVDRNNFEEVVEAYLDHIASALRTA